MSDTRGTVHIHTTPEDLALWNEVTKKANALIALGEGSATFDIYPGMTPVMITALEWMQIIKGQGSFARQLSSGHCCKPSLPPERLRRRFLLARLTVTAAGVKHTSERGRDDH